MEILSHRDRPDLRPALEALMQQVWPPMLHQDEVGHRHWPTLFSRFPEFQLSGVDEHGTLVAAFNAVPVDWDGPESQDNAWRDDGWRGAMQAGCTAPPGRAQSLCALAASILAPHRGRGLSRLLLEAARDAARDAGFIRMVAPVRPTGKPQYPLIPLADYVGWRRGDGSAFDPWIRVHERLGAVVVGIAPRSMHIEGRVEQWEAWTGMRFPQSGDYIVPDAFHPVHIDVAEDRGLYVEPNVWMEHRL